MRVYWLNFYSFPEFPNKMFIIRNKKIFISISAVLVAVSILSLLFFGVRVGIDFKGGALTEVVYTAERPAQADLELSQKLPALSPLLVQPVGDRGYLIKSRDLSEAEHRELLLTLSEDNASPLEELNFNSIGPSVGRELTRKAVLAVILVTLLHDVAIPTGLFVLLSHLYGVELDTLFVVAVLTVLGLSVSDTIVIFDRIRENLRIEGNGTRVDFQAIVGRSLEQSYVRSISTSLTVILVLLSLIFFGPVSTKYFAIMLSAGMIVGTYSSICLASPLLVWMYEWQGKKSDKVV